MQEHIFPGKIIQKPLLLQYLCAPSSLFSSPFPTSISLVYSSLLFDLILLHFLSLLCRHCSDFPSILPSQAFVYPSFPSRFMYRQVTIRLLLEAVVQNGDRIVNTPVKRLFYSVGDKNTIHSGEWSVTNGERLIQ